MTPSNDKTTDPSVGDARAAADAELDALRADAATLDEGSEEHQFLLAEIEEREAELVALDDVEPEPQKATPAKKAAAPKKAAAKPAKGTPDTDPAAPSTVPYLSDLVGNHPHLHDGFVARYHEPTVPAVVADPDGRVGFQVADAGVDATHIAFEDGTTFAVDPETGRIADKA